LIHRGNIELEHMHTVIIRIIATAAIIGAGLTTIVFAQDMAAGALVIKGAWSRATPPGAPAAGYVEIENTGDVADRLIAVRAAFAVAELHTTSVENDVAKMTPLTDGKSIPPGETVAFAPMGDHIMFIDLASPLVEGQSFTAQLVFELAGPVDVEFSVKSIDAKNGHSH